MILWFLSLVAGTSLAALSYRARPSGPLVPVFGLRVLAGTVAAALLLNAPLGPRNPVAPWVGLDVSASWRASGDSTAWPRALATVDSLRRAGADSILLFGDSVRHGGELPAEPADGASRVGPLVEAALAVGRPLVLVTDGALTDPERVVRLPRGSSVLVITAREASDAAIALLDVPGGALGGDTLQARIVVKAGAGGAPANTLALSLDGRPVGEAAIPALEAYEEREVRLPVALPATDATRRISAVLRAPARDAVAENDTASAEVVVSGAAAATFISTSPDQDARFALAVLRGTRRGPVQGFWRVAPGEWRMDGSLREVSERAVRDAAAATPLLVLHGDTAVFGAPRALGRGALVLFAPPPAAEDYYPSGTGDSPVSAALAGVPWDSLPPLDVAVTRLRGRDVHAAVLTRRGRRFEERTAILLEDAPRRVVVVPAAGFWRWRLRGGRSGDAFNAMWGSVFDWVGADPRAGSTTLAANRGVNAEWVPRRATIAGGSVGDGVVLDRAPRALGRSAWWLALIAIAALCAEWLLRRRIGLR